MSLNCSAIDDLTIRSIASTHSVKNAFACVQNLSFTQLNGLIFPTPALVNVQYCLQWNGSSYVLVEADVNPGTKFNIQPSDNIYVHEDYQYIVYDHIYVLGTLTVDGELVIL
jgi:hypothetical protein